MENIRICKRVVNVLDRICGISLYLLGAIFTVVYAWRWFGPMGSAIPTITVIGAAFCCVGMIGFGCFVFFALLRFMIDKAKWRVSKLGLFFATLSKDLGQSIKSIAISATSN